jgi:hypothetical protein
VESKIERGREAEREKGRREMRRSDTLLNN